MSENVPDVGLAPKNSRSHWRRALLWGIQCLIAISLLLFLFRRLDIGVLLDLAGNTRWGWLAVSFLAFMLMFAIQGLQFKILLGTPQSVSRLYSLAVLRRFIGDMIPGSAEISFALLAKSRYQIDVASSVAGVLLSRFWTGVAAVMWATLAGAFVFEEKWYWWVPVLLFLTPVFFGIIILGLHHASVIKKIPLASASWLRGYQQKLISWLEKYQIVQKQVLSNCQLQWQIALLNMLAYSISLVRLWTTFEALSIGASFWESTAIAVVLATLAQLPVNFMGGLGTTSISLYALLLAFNILPEPEAAASGLLYQGVFYVLMFSNGLVAWLIWLVAPTADKSQSVLTGGSLD